MESIDTIRNAVEALAKDRAGKAKKQPHGLAVQLQGSDFISIIMSLPVENADWSPLQNPTTGQLYFVAGASGFGSEPLGG